ncbi:uncharacterized protein DUF2853 [Palleronia aestuarii]|uniref:Uncharacterized protein DUF2853 n=1 Tax=Palleronia aestuarii TaxID=568105 RepID=A0A2W7NGJ6_9RHOB|nr:DUF2853 family protein [Palleronia aestuarii]PZX19000.1 uncharacterized protein DUF2853 [Palleronia aestuarii]
MPDRDKIMGSAISDLKEIEDNPDMTLLDRIVADLMPEIEDRGERLVSDSDRDELLRIREEFLIGRLGLKDDESLMGGIQKAIRLYPRAEPEKQRAVVYYLLVKHFGKEDAYA